MVTASTLLAICGQMFIASAVASAPLAESAASSFLHQGRSCCAALSLALPGKVLYPDTTTYNQSLASYWSVQVEDVHPTCIVSPTCTEEVAVAVLVLNRGGRLFPRQCDFAVRSGGHTPFAGAANIEQGITIDLSALDQVTPSADLATVTVGPGNRWESVYLKLDALGIAIGGGRVASVGVGGLTLGGGVSFFSPRYGFVCDNIIRFEVVLASGLTVNATETSHTDLWLALKGGSNNFGIVTAFESTAFKQYKFWGGAIVSNISTRDAHFAAFEALTGSPDYDEYAALINSYAFITPGNSWIVDNEIVYTKNETYPAFFKNFTDIPYLYSTMRISNLTDFTLELAAANPFGRRDLFVTATFGNSAQMMSKIFDIANQSVQALTGVPNMVFSLSFQPEPTIITSKAATRGGNSLGLSEADGNVFNLLLSVSWDTEADDDIILQQAKSLFARSVSVAKQMGLYNKYLYLNYAASWQDPISGYGPEVVARLQATSRKYDPAGVFQNQVPGGFKLFNRTGADPS